MCLGFGTELVLAAIGVKLAGVVNPKPGLGGLLHSLDFRVQGFQACTPRVLPLGLGILLRDDRDYLGAYKGYIKATVGKPFAKIYNFHYP